MTTHSSQEETLTGGVPNVHGLHGHRIHRTSKAAKKENRRASRCCISAVGPAYSAGVRAAVPLPVPTCSAPAAHWPLEDQLCPSRLKSYLQGQGRLTRPPRDGSLRIHLSPGPSGRTVGMKSQVLVDRLLPAGSPSMSDCSDTGVSVVTDRPAPAQTEPSLIAQLWVRLQQRHAPVSSL
jgi:hypothetical protein